MDHLRFKDAQTMRACSYICKDTYVYDTNDSTKSRERSN